LKYVITELGYLVITLPRLLSRSVVIVGTPGFLSTLNIFSGTEHTNLTRSFLQVNFEKRYVHAQGGVTLRNLHAVLETNGLAMINLGSISEQTLAGMMTTATHGTGIHHQVLSAHVQAVRLLQADGTKVTCSRDHQSDLFYATLCGLGSTGIILDIRMEVRPAFRLREEQETCKFNDVIDKFDQVAVSAEFVRLWWWPQADDIRVSRMNETYEVSKGHTPNIHSTPMRSSDPARQHKRPQKSWLWHSSLVYHVIECLLFLGIFITTLNVWIGRFSSWLVRDKTLSIDDSLSLFNIDCKVRATPSFPSHLRTHLTTLIAPTLYH